MNDNKNIYMYVYLKVSWDIDFMYLQISKHIVLCPRSFDFIRYETEYLTRVYYCY